MPSMYVGYCYLFMGSLTRCYSLSLWMMSVSYGTSVSAIMCRVFLNSRTLPQNNIMVHKLCVLPCLKSMAILIDLLQDEMPVNAAELI